MNRSPIFIHSLFRAGSTYIFKAFRRGASGYWCYQEALHELALFSREDPSGLQLDHGESKVRLLRHPELDTTYFQELFDVWPAWKDSLCEPFIYDDYFGGASESGDIGISYWRTLIDAAKGRPVFQECRTSGRIATIKQRLDGFHVYLWRNPWDQWWSYKVTPYFDVVNQLIIHARRAPMSINKMRADLALPDYSGSDLGGAFSFYGGEPLTSEQSYLVFYLLWCLGIREGVAHADMLISIDQLSDSEQYRQDVVKQLNEAGIEGLDFSDCQVPQARYLARDIKFFERLERRVHLWLEEDDWTVEDFDRIRAIREQFQPKSWLLPISQLVPEDLAEQAVRARELTVRFETDAALRIRQADAQLGQLKDRVQTVEAATQQSESLLHRAEQREAEARARVEQALTLVSEAQGLAVEAESRTRQAQACVLEQQQRADTAEAHALEQQQRADTAEAQAREQQQQADARAHQAEAREAEISIQLQQALSVAQQAQLAESRAARAESQLAEAQHQLAAMHRVNHENWQLAQQQDEHVQAVHKSTSWRITAPLRSAKLIASRLGARVGAMRQALQDSEATVCGVGRLALKRLVSCAQRSPRFKRIALRMLSFSPRLTVKLRRIYLQTRYSQNSNYLDSPIDVEPTTHEQISPTIDIYGEYNNRPAAEGLNAELRTPLEKYFHARRVEK